MSHSYQLSSPKISSYAEKIVLKMLFKHDGFSGLVGPNGWNSDFVAESLGLPLEMEREDNCKQIAREMLAQRYQVICAEHEISSGKYQQAEENFNKLMDFLALNTVEISLLRLAFYIRIDKVFQRFLDNQSEVNFIQCLEIISELLEISLSKVRNALKSDGKLISYGLLDKSNFSYNHADSLDDFFSMG